MLVLKTLLHIKAFRCLSRRQHINMQRSHLTCISGQFILVTVRGSFFCVVMAVGRDPIL